MYHPPHHHLHQLAEPDRVTASVTMSDDPSNAGLDQRGARAFTGTPQHFIGSVLDDESKLQREFGKSSVRVSTASLATASLTLVCMQVVRPH